MLVRAILLLVFLIVNMPLRADTITVYTWPDYMSPAVGEKFYQETGHVLNIVTFPNSRTRERTILKGHGKIDLVMLGSTSFQFLKQMGKLTNISGIAFDNKKYIDPRWQKYCGKHGIPYSWGTSGIAYRSSVATAKINSWEQFFHPEPAFNGRIVYSLDDVLPMAIALLTLDAFITSPEKEDLDQAVNLLNGQSGNILAYDHGLIHAKQHGTDSQMAMTLTYSSDFTAIKTFTGKEDWVYVVPEEGTILWVDCLAIPAFRPLRPVTLEFLNFINRPDIAARNAEQTGFSTPNSSALPLTSKTHQLSPHTFTNPDLIKNTSDLMELDRKSFTEWRNIMRKIKESSDDNLKRDK